MSNPGKKKKAKGHRQFHQPKVCLMDADGFANYQEDGKSLVLLSISKREIETLDTNSALERLYVLTDSKENALRYRESVMFQVGGYDADRRELPEIAEVRAYFKQLVKDWPHWVWFMCRGTGSIALLFSVLCEVRVLRNTLGGFGTEFRDRDEVAAVLTDMLMRSSALFEAYQIDIEATEQSTDTALKELGY